MNSRRYLSIWVLALAAATIALAEQSKPLREIVTSPSGRAKYLGHSVMWQDPAVLSPIELRNGPPDVFPYTFEEATSEQGITCTFEEPGRTLGGKSQKFGCIGPGEHTLRLKYWDRERQTGNREAFATVAASRLMWALGFVSVPALPTNVQCRDCPEDPHNGSGTRALRRYVAMWQVSVPGPRIVSGTDNDQGWDFRELDEAINALPPGEERKRQRAIFEGLTLLGVFIQHGDRKHEQQALYCMDDVDLSAGEVRESKNGGHQILNERDAGSACPHAAAVLVDVGATFGGAGRTSNGTTAKMNLKKWREKPVFESGGDTCRGDLTISMAAGSGGEGHPEISEDGRLFLLEQVRRLTVNHIRAIFEAARVDRIHEPGSQEQTEESIDAWVAAFQDKVRQIEARRCRVES